MWKCTNCGGENSDSVKICEKCGGRNGIAPPKGSQSSYLSSSKQERMPGQNERTCSQAIDLEKWGNVIFVGFIILGIIALISSGFTYEMNYIDELELEFHFTSLINGILPCLYWIGGGGALKLILQSFAIVVENAYRNLKPKKTDTDN